MLVSPQPEAFPKFELDDYARVAIYFNPASSGAAAVRSQLESFQEQLLSKHGKPSVLLDTKANSREMADEVLANDHNAEGDALAIFSGDGGTSSFLSAVLETGTKSPVAILGGGEANDIAHSLHSGRRLAHPLGLLTARHAHIGRLYPLDVRAAHSRYGKEHWRAFAYFGVGMTGVAAEHYNEPEFRQAAMESGILARINAQRKGALQSINNAPLLRINKDDEGIIERNFANIPVEAKYTHFRGVNPLEKDAAMMQMRLGKDTSLRRKLATIRGIAQAWSGQMPHLEPLPDDENAMQTFVVASSTGQIPTQTDGEPTLFYQGTEFTVGISEQSVPVVVTRRRLSRS